MGKDMIEKIIKTVKEYHPDTDEDFLWQAYYFGKKAHEGQTRKTGEPYFEHSLATAEKLAYLKMDPRTVAAGMLHDVPEDTKESVNQLERKFGREVAHLVKGVTKLSKVRYRYEERYVKSLQKLFLAMSKDLRVIVIKFADRLNNLKTLYVHPPETGKRIAQEVLEIYAPIAGLLGIWEIKWEI